MGTVTFGPPTIVTSAPAPWGANVWGTDGCDVWDCWDTSTKVGAAWNCCTTSTFPHTVGLWQAARHRRPTSMCSSTVVKFGQDLRGPDTA